MSRRLFLQKYLYIFTTLPSALPIYAEICLYEHIGNPSLGMDSCILISKRSAEFSFALNERWQLGNSQREGKKKKEMIKAKQTLK